MPENETIDPLASLKGFFFANDTNDPRVNSKLRERIAYQMMQNRRPYPKTVGEGLSAIGDAIGQRGLMDRLAQADIAERQAAPGLVAGIGGAPPAVAPPPAAPAAAPPVVVPPTTPTSYAPTETSSTAAGAPAAQSRSIPVADIPVEDGGYNFMDAQARHGLPPMQGRMQEPILAATDNPDMQAYLGTLSAREQPRPGQVSSTGATGPFQFTRGTGRGYGLVGDQGDQRNDPVASSRAAVQLTDDNAAIFRRITGREPTMADLALMHQQGGTTGTRMITGTGNASPENLRVNNVPPGATPQQATAAIKGYYGMPEAPIDARARVAAAVAQANGGGKALPFAPQDPPAPLPPQITAAPPQGPQIMSLPRGELQTTGAQPGVQQPGDIPGYVPPEPTAPKQPRPTDMTQREADLRNFIATTPNDYAKTLAQGQLQQIEARRTAQDAHNNEVWKKELEHYNTMRLEREKARMDQSKRIADVQKTRQGLISQPAGAPAGNDPRLLGTPQSPQRTGIPTPDPLPAGVTPEKHAEQQAAKFQQDRDALEKGVPLFNEAMKTIQQARAHPGRKWGLGMTADIAARIGGSDAVGFQQINEQLKSRNFLTGIQAIRGTGAISEKEGDKVQTAQGRLAAAQNQRDYDAALADMQEALQDTLARTQRRMNMPVTAYRHPGDNSSYAPDIGQRSPGGTKEYVGGNPQDPMSWRDVK